MNSAKRQDEQYFLDLLVALLHSVKKFSITFTNLPHSLIGIFSVASLIRSVGPVYDDLTYDEDPPPTLMELTQHSWVLDPS